MSSEIRIIKDPWEHFFARPGMYIGKKSIYGLQCFIAGVHAAQWSGGRENKFQKEWLAFEDWVANKTGKKLNGRSFQAALNATKDDDEKAFDVWCEWHKEYMEWTNASTPTS